MSKLISKLAMVMAAVSLLGTVTFPKPAAALTVTTPHVKTPHVKTPHVKLPKLPHIKLPHVTTPHVTIPRIHF